MKKVFVTVVLTLAAFSVAAASVAAAPSLNCKVGPASKIFGQTQWLVYGCDDQHSVVVVSAPGSPAMPFYFFFAYENGKFRLRGEGTGSKLATDAAYTELSKLSNEDVAKLYTESAKGEKP